MNHSAGDGFGRSGAPGDRAPSSGSLIQVILQDGLVTRALVPGRYLIGHTDLCDIRLQHPSVAPRHAQLVISDIALIVDLFGSTGTCLNGERVRGPRTLSNGDRLRFGSCELTVWLRPLQRAFPQATGDHSAGLAPFDGASSPESTEPLMQRGPEHPPLPRKTPFRTPEQK